MKIDSNEYKWYIFSNWLLYFKDKLFVPTFKDLRMALLHKYHKTLTRDHYGVKPNVAYTKI